MAPALSRIDPSEFRRDTLREQAYEFVKEALISGDLEPGQKFTYRGLAETFQMSVTPIREAMLRLASEKALDVSRNGQVSIPTLDDATFRELHVICRITEPVAVETAAKLITPEEIEIAEQHLADLGVAVKDGDERSILKHNYAFHFAVYRPSGMPMLVDIIEKLWLRKGPFMMTFFPRFSSEDRHNEGFVDMLSAMRAHDGLKARKIMEGKMDRAYDYWSHIRERDRLSRKEPA